VLADAVTTITNKNLYSNISRGGCGCGLKRGVESPPPSPVCRNEIYYLFFDTSINGVNPIPNTLKLNTKN